MSFISQRSVPRLTAHSLSADHVVVLLATHNGGATIDAQLESLLTQTHDDWSLIVSDDGSTDDTMERVARFAARSPKRRIVRLRGPGRGSAMNFLSLLRAAGKAPYVAFADQDDVWLPDRLERGLDALRPLSGPAVHGGRTIITDSDLRPLRLSRRFSREPDFRNALVQNVAGGNTMLINRAALDVLQPASARLDRLVAHDWWTYQMVTSVGGRMIWDPRPTVLYRQHDANQIGANDTLTASLRRCGHLFSGRFAVNCAMQLEALARNRDRMTRDARQTLDTYLGLRHAPLRDRLSAFRRTGIFRQTWPGTIALWIALVLGRL